MLQADKIHLTFPISKRLFAYLFGSEVGLRHYANPQINSEAFGDLKATIVNDSFLFGIGNEGGSEVIVASIATSDSQMTVTGDSGTTIPPDDFVYTPSATAEDSSAPRGRAFFRKPARGSGHSIAEAQRIVLLLEVTTTVRQVVLIIVVIRTMLQTELLLVATTIVQRIGLPVMEAVEENRAEAAVVDVADVADGVVTK